MIQPNDLRIGNLVSDEWFDSFKQFILVCDINARGINLEITDDGNYSELAQHFITPDYEFCKLRGIPLTQEILLKVGFHKKYPFLDLIIAHDFWLISFESKISIQLAGNNISLGSIKYLHQLQNLYFALTGQELNTAGLI